MAVIHDAVLRPSKAEALAAWLPAQPWSGLTAGQPVEVVTRFRFDDPAGEVGVEVILVQTPDGRLLHTPLTYRGAPLDGARGSLVCEMHHSVLGQRWVYDAVADPVYADVLRRAIATGGHEAELERADGSGRFDKEGTAVGSGSAPDSPTVTSATASTDGTETTVHTDHGDLVVLRVIGLPVPDGETLTVTWSDRSAVVAVLPA